MYSHIGLKYIAKWRWIILILVLSVIALQDKVFFHQQYGAITGSGFILSEVSDITNICFVYLIAFFIIGSDVYQPNGKLSLQIAPAQLLRRISTQSIALALVFTTIIFLINAVAPITYQSFFNAEVWLQENSLNGHSSYYYLTWAYLLVFLRFSWNTLLIGGTNFTFKTNIGIIVPFFAAIIDTYFYEIFGIPYPYNLLPIEHSRVVYTVAVVPEVLQRKSLFSSAIYWAGLWGITIVLFLLCRHVIEKASKKKRGNKSDTKAL